MFLNLPLASGHTSPIIASGILNPAVAYLPCSKALHVKCRLLPVRGAGYKLLIPFRGYSAELKRERNQRSLSRQPHAGAERAVQSFRDNDASTLHSFQHVRRRQGSTFQGTSTCCILRTRAEGIQPPAEAGPRMLPDRSLDRVVEGRIGLEKEAYGRLARGIRTFVALCAHLSSPQGTPSFLLSSGPSHQLGRSQPQSPLVTRKLLLEMLSKVDNSTETPWD
jgi:hypothetical protein